MANGLFSNILCGSLVLCSAVSCGHEKSKKSSKSSKGEVPTPITDNSQLQTKPIVPEFPTLAPTVNTDQGKKADTQEATKAVISNAEGFSSIGNNYCSIKMSEDVTVKLSDKEAVVFSKGLEIPIVAGKITAENLNIAYSLKGEITQINAGSSAEFAKKFVNSCSTDQLMTYPKPHFVVIADTEAQIVKDSDGNISTFTIKAGTDLTQKYAGVKDLKISATGMVIDSEDGKSYTLVPSAKILSLLAKY